MITPEQRYKLVSDNIILMFPFGSIVYGTITDKSDEDWVAVIRNGVDDFNDCYDNKWLYTEDNKDITFITETKWLEMIDNHHIYVLEGLSLPDNKVIIGNMDKYRQMFKLDKWKLRKTISAIAENAYAKCHKKLTVKKDFDQYRAQKSIFHSIRILDFGKQIAEHGKIVDYSSCNHFWDEIYKMNSSNWEEYKDKYKPLLNTMRTEFVKLCPKPITP